MWNSTVQQWQEGELRLGEAPAEHRAALERVTARIAAELRRRLGGRFTTAELAELYEQGTDWCLQMAIATEPERPEAWDTSTVADAAFWRYAHGAADFAGGRGGR